MQLLRAAGGNVTALAFAPTSGALVAVSAYAAPQLWALPATGEPVVFPNTVMYGNSSFVFSPDASVVSWITNHKRMEFDRAVGAVREFKRVPDGETVVAQTACGPDARLVIRATGPHGVEASIRAFALNGRGGWSELWAVGPSDAVHGGWMAASVTGDRFFTWEGPRYTNANTPRRMVARSALTGEEIGSTTIPAQYVRMFAARPDGSAVVTFKDSSLYYWSPGEKLQKVRTGTLRHYRSIAFHPDGRHLLAGNNDATARLLDTQTWQVVRQYTWAIGRLSAVAVSPDGALAAAGGTGGWIVVWDLDV
jgi:WD40 repeat protein